MNLKEIRKEQNMSQVELSVLVGVEQPTISAWEKGTHSITVSNVIKLVGILGCTSDELLVDIEAWECFCGCINIFGYTNK